MNHNSCRKNIRTLIIIVFACFINFAFCQDSTVVEKPVVEKNKFWKKVQFTGGLNLNFGSGFTNVGVSPNILYNVNKFISVGTGFQFNFVNTPVNKSFVYGINLTTLFNTTESIQLSLDFEQLRINSISKSTLDGANIFPKQNLWNLSLFFGAGYRMGNVTVGGRYNVLFNKNNRIYNSAFTPFVRIFL